MTTPSLGDLRQAIQLGDVVLFEATGAVQTDGPVGAESAEDRKEKQLDFETAIAAARKMLFSDKKLSLLLDVRTLRN